MFKAVGISVLCLASMAVHAETFVIETAHSGREATIKIPVGAITKLSADHAESLENYGDAKSEAMRLRGDVLISIAGSQQPIEIKADTVLLELTPDASPGESKSHRADAATHKVLRSTSVTGGDANQTFLGNVVFDLQTASGPMEIKADKVEHQLEAEAGA